MAELSQRDKEVLLGQGRIQNERIDALAADSKTPEKRLTTCESQKMTAAFIIIMGVALLVGGWSLNGDHIGFEKLLGAFVVVAGVVWYAYLRATARRLRAAGVQPG